ncbi:MAG: SCP-2 sterol transfer family protein [bacterium ADurb.Bin236]|nr:MAG: SCP-2 sterol transfer family protein [bacterium ADurb.Bin236]HPN95380.1 SCP2 sterol-binding domain-containing protein [bacterium]
MAKYFDVSVEDIFNTMEARFRVEGAKGVNAVLAYDISGDGGGKWLVEVRDDSVKVAKTDDLSGFSVKTSADAETFVGVNIGKIDGTQAFMSGKIKIEGDMALVAASAKMFTRYSLPKKSAVTVQGIFDTLVARFQPQNAAGLDISVGYDITGDGGGQWTAVLKDGKCALETGLRDNCAVVNSVKAKDYIDLILGKLDPMVAMGSGRLKLKGDMNVAMQLPKIFAKFEPPKEEEEQELIVIKRNISVDMKYSTGPVMGKFFEGLIEKKILANKCPKCGRMQVPPREVCAECRCWAGDMIEVGPSGTITLIEIIYYSSPDPLTGETRETPYAQVHILLDGIGKEETFWHLLKNEDLADTKKGDRVRPVWSDNRVGSVHDIIHFERIRD